MKHIVFLATIVAYSTFVTAALAQGDGNGELTARDRALSRKAAKFGGMLHRSNVHPGKFSFLNVQSTVADSNLVGTISFLRKTLRANIVLEKSKAVTVETATAVRKDAKADVAIFLVELQTLPDMMLVSPEGKWAMVNVTALTADNSAQPFVVARLNKEMVRAFVYLAGGCGSDFAGNLMDNIVRPDQLDSYGEARPPMDLLARISRRLPQLGVTPYRLATYQQACKEGWAPQPTNDVQKAIWERVKADKERGPTNPITIPPPKAKK